MQNIQPWATVTRTRARLMFFLRDVGAVKRRNEMINKLKPAPKLTLKKNLYYKKYWPVRLTRMKTDTPLVQVKSTMDLTCLALLQHTAYSHVSQFGSDSWDGETGDAAGELMSFVQPILVWCTVTLLYYARISVALRQITTTSQQVSSVRNTVGLRRGYS